jgi:hypothetical protein
MAVQKELDAQITFQEARDNETTFFATTPPWCDELSALSHRFGVRALSAELSRQLVALTSRALPGMKQCVDESLEEVATQLEALPKPLG